MLLFTMNLSIIIIIIMSMTLCYANKYYIIIQYVMLYYI